MGIVNDRHADMVTMSDRFMSMIVHMDMNEALAKAVNAERGAAGMTIKELAEKTGISERTLIRLLNSERDIRVNQLAAFAKVFNITPVKLVEEAEDFKTRAEQPTHWDISSLGGAMAQLRAKAGWKPKFDKAALHDPNKKQESETPND